MIGITIRGRITYENPRQALSIRYRSAAAAFELNHPRIPLLVPDLPRRADLEPFLAEIDNARWYTNFGPLVRRFEHSVQSLFPAPAPFISTVANGTMALELALAALRLPPRAHVLIPAFTFVATAAAVLRAGLRPIIADIDAHSWVLTPAIARAAMTTTKIDCVLPVAALGCPLPAAEWDDFSESSGIPVLVDAAGAFGNQQPGERIVLAFSLHATKTLGIGEGGLVVSRDAAFIERVRRLSNFGIDPSNGHAPDVGGNAKLSELHAAVGLAALTRWPERRRLREALNQAYCDELLRNSPEITLQARPLDGAYTVFQLLLQPGVSRDALVSTLTAQGIETRAWYLPLLPDHPAYAGIEAFDLPVARSLGPRMLGLPFHLELTQESIRRVCSALAKAIN